MKKTFFIFIFFILVLPISVYAAVTLIDYIRGWQISDNMSWTNQYVRTINTGDMMFMNEGNDENQIWNFFVGDYYDDAYGVFTMNALLNQEVQIKNVDGTCWDGSTRYALEWYSYSENFWIMNFDNDISQANVFVCIQEDINHPDYGNARFEGYAFSPYIWTQSFDGIEFEANTNIEEVVTDEDGVLGRFTKIDGIATSSNNNLDNSFDDEIRVLGNVEKSSLKWDIVRNAYSAVRNIQIVNGTSPYTADGIWNASWSDNDGVLLQNGKVLYFWDMQGENVLIAWNQAGNKTLVVEWWNIYITWDIRWNGILWLIALKDSENRGWNIYIDPTVTDIHAFMYADRAVVSYNNSNGEFDGSDADSLLANQLYIKWSIISENTLGGWDAWSCPFYVDNWVCNSNIAKKFDFNYLRRYKLVQEYDADWNPTGNQIPDYSGAESYAWDSVRGHSNPDYRKFPLIIEYDSRVQQTPPVLFN